MFTFNIIEHICVLSEKRSGWKKELNLVSWNGNEPKYDIREWSPDHEQMSKASSLTSEEFERLIMCGHNYLAEGGRK